MGENQETIFPDQLLVLDFGILNTVCSVLNAGTTSIVTNLRGDKKSPTLLAISENKLCFGELADGCPSNSKFFRNYKNLINDLNDKKVTAEEYTFKDYVFPIEELLTYTIEGVQKYHECKEKTQIIVIVPTWWNLEQRQKVFNANKILCKAIKNETKIVDILDSTVAEAFDFIVKYPFWGKKKIMCFVDFGYTHFMISFFEGECKQVQGREKTNCFTVRELLTKNIKIGGRDIDEDVKKMVIESMEGRYPHLDDVKNDKARIQHAFRPQMKKMKENFTINDEIMFDMKWGDQTYDFAHIFNIKEFEKYIKEDIDVCVECANEALKELKEKYSINNIDVMELCGGSSRIRLLRSKIKESFTKELNKEPKDTSAEEPKDTSADEPKDTSADEPKDSFAEEPKDSFAEEPKDSFAEEPKEVPITYRLNIDSCFAEGGCYYFAMRGGGKNIVKLIAKSDELRKDINKNGVMRDEEVDSIVKNIEKIRNLSDEAMKNDEIRNDIQALYLSKKRAARTLKDNDYLDFARLADDWFEETADEVNPKKFQTQYDFWTALLKAYELAKDKKDYSNELPDLKMDQTGGKVWIRFPTGQCYPPKISDELKRLMRRGNPIAENPRAYLNKSRIIKK